MKNPWMKSYLPLFANLSRKKCLVSSQQSANVYGIRQFYDNAVPTGHGSLGQKK